MHISPIRAAKIATSYAATRFNMWKFAGYSDRRFRDDVRYNLQAVTDGFLPRIGDSDDDSELLGRICEAFIRAAQQQKSVPAVYQPKEWWQQARQGSLRPVIEALLTRNIGALRKMYQIPQVAGVQARQAGHSAQQELELLCVHGILHLLGYDHADPEEEAEMFGLQGELLAAWRAEATEGREGPGLCHPPGGCW